MLLLLFVCPHIVADVCGVCVRVFLCVCCICLFWYTQRCVPMASHIVQQKHTAQYTHLLWVSDQSLVGSWLFSRKPIRTRSQQQQQQQRSNKDARHTLGTWPVLCNRALHVHLSCAFVYVSYMLRTRAQIKGHCLCLNNNRLFVSPYPRPIPDTHTHHAGHHITHTHISNTRSDLHALCGCVSGCVECVDTSRTPFAAVPLIQSPTSKNRCAERRAKRRQ